jgi:threonine dehydrogenase-like Zn-dependent dehydrogenase
VVPRGPVPPLREHRLAHNPDGIRYGYTSAEKAPHLWGGFAQYVYLPWNAVVHHVPKGVSPSSPGW